MQKSTEELRVRQEMGKNLVEWGVDPRKRLA